MDVLAEEPRTKPPWAVLLADDLVLVSETVEEVEEELERWRAVIENKVLIISRSKQNRGDRGWLSHGLVVTLPIYYSLDGGTLWGFTRDMRIAD